MTIDISKLVPEHISSLALYQPGKLIEDVLEEMGLHSAVKLASNENSLGPSPLAFKAVVEALAGLSRYGDADNRRLREKISRLTKVPVGGVQACNGSSEFILTLCHALLAPGLSAVMSKPSFTLYAKNSQAAGAKVVETPLTADFEHDVDEMLAQMDDSTRLVFLDNPLNPTGAYLQPEKIEHLLNNINKNAILVLDEAYIDFVSEKRPDYNALLSKHKVIVIRTFSKIMGLAGLRAGYALMAPELAEVLNKVRQPFNLNSLAQAGAIAAMDDLQHIARTQEMTWLALETLKKELPEFGFSVYPTQANFMMAAVPEGRQADELVQALLREGVIIRSLASFGLPGHVRLNAGLPEELDVLFKALKKILG
ncbi:MAG: histidinol-phosphate transaminase [Deltaproteobacteria bacterium]|jgi:histidinol-phosphate aminotransferase|nr:histidinol-phosphate transaminase [Deltaproteobacteria bacterium]